jgi:hypothetical protein
MLAALLFACNCVSHDPLFTTAGLAQDPSAIYRSGGGLIVRDEKTPPYSSTQLTDGHGTIRALDVDGAFLYFADMNSLQRVSVYGGPSTQLASARGPIITISHDAEAVYWVETSDKSDGLPQGYAYGSIGRMNKRSGVVGIVVDAGLAVVSSRLMDSPYVDTSPRLHDQVVAFDEKSIYTTALFDHQLWRIDKATGAWTQLVTRFEGSPEVFLDGTYIYVGGLYMPRKGGPPRRLPYVLPGEDILAVAGGRILLASAPVKNRFGSISRLVSLSSCQGIGGDLLSSQYPLSEFAIDTCDVYGIPAVTSECALRVFSYITLIEPSETVMSGGTFLTIYGAGFDPDVGVTVGGKAARVLSVAPDRITVLTAAAPPGPTFVVISNGHQCASEPITVVGPGRREAVPRR